MSSPNAEPRSRSWPAIRRASSKPPRRIQGLGGQPLPIPTDVADADQVEAAAQRAEAELGPIDIWVNDAMATVFAWFTDTTAEEFTRATQVTYLGAVYGTMAALKRMVPRDRGTIVQVGSALSYRAIPLQAAYCGAKFGYAGSPTRSASNCAPRRARSG